MSEAEGNYRKKYIAKERKLPRYSNLWLISGICLLTSMMSWFTCFFIILGAPSHGGGDPYAQIFSLLIAQIVPIVAFGDKKEYLQKLFTSQIGGMIGLFLGCFFNLLAEVVFIRNWDFIEIYKHSYYLYEITFECPERKIFYSLFLWPLAGFIGSSIINFYKLVLSELG